MSTKQLKSAKPEISVAMFVSRTGRCASIRMSTIGELERSSTTPQRTKNAAATTRTPSSARRAPNPSCSPSVSATISDSSRRRAAARPATSTLRRRANRRLRHVPVRRARARAQPGSTPSRKSSRHEKLSTITPESTIPKPPPMPQHRREQADPDLDLFGRELVADDREAEREERAAGAGDDAERDQRPDVPRERRGQAAGEKEPEADQAASAPCRTGRRAGRGWASAPRRRRGSRSGPTSSTPWSSRTPPGRSGAPGRPSSAAARTRCLRASGCRE